MRLLSFGLFAFTLLSFACKNKPAGSMQKAAEFADLPKDFLSFYQQFHADSAFQMAHIEWPLKGEKAVRVDSTGMQKVLTTWEPTNWVMLHEPDMTDVGLKRYFETISDVLVIERLQYPMVNYGLERQFYKDENNDWHMIYYSEMQELR